MFRVYMVEIMIMLLGIVALSYAIYTLIKSYNEKL